MSSNSPKGGGRRISLRLTLWFSAIFCLGYLAILLAAYVSLSTYLRQKDQALIEASLKDYQAQYRAGGMIALKNAIKFEKYAGKPNIFFVRVAGPENRALLMYFPDQWAGFDLNRLEGPGKTERWLRLEAGEPEDVLEVTTSILPDGFILQVGKSTGDREGLLRDFRRMALGIAVLVLLMGLLCGQFLAGRALRPIRHLIQTVGAITATGRL